ncbi:hypothetical protein L1987_34314 [Smallanthus sonchifolius]|uniref:Uncharacterized protein n=1 Tax=Smallanthus sonchifolius TaxID=185202 RepID=A0ACB9HU66_9ASTR|nr:hypothetical protein L1987_34314 [Smallanthus sonchifolius]
MSLESNINCNDQSGIDHFLKRVASLSRRATPTTPARSRHVKKPGFARAVCKAHVKPSRSQLSACDLVWCAYLDSFVVWKIKDVGSLEGDLVRSAFRMEISMMQKCKPEGDNADLTHDMKAIR